MPGLLEVSNLQIALKKGDKTINAVDNVSFSINEGEIAGLAGETGCGKTLTALSVAGLLPQKAKILGGEIIFGGRRLTSLNEKDYCGIRGKEISMIFQEVRQSLNPLIKVGRQIREALELNGVSTNIAEGKNNKRRTVEMLFRLGFDEPKKIYNAYPHQLSGGMCQLIMSAIAVITNPRLLLADEPSSSLDAQAQERILSMLVEMNREHKTAVLIISHDLSVIRSFCSRFLVMYAGKIVEEGRADALYSPLHPYTQALIGAIPGRDKRGRNLANIPGKVPSVEDNFTGCPFAPRCIKAQNICVKSFPGAVENGGGKVFCHFPGGGNQNG
ncbi:MAG: ABC transporter ATP-binding protein [Treponema sp.]|jgi:oligopeptide/dipeptide ABC transporter ATP-binding protein|nr:ABC transporter ATP-binding protein [Treponema sp.]